MMRDRQRWLRVVLALVVVGVAVLVRVALVPVMGLNVPYVTVYPAIMIVAVAFGTGPGLLAAMAGILLAEYHFMRPEGAITWDLSLAVRSLIVLGASLYIGRIGQKLRAARAQAQTEAGLARAAEQALRQQVALVDPARAEIIVREMQRVLLARQVAVAPPTAPAGERWHRIPMVTGMAVAAVGVLVLAGWACGIGALMSVVPGLATMKANTALCFLIIGLGVAWRQPRAWRLAAPALVIVVAALTLAEYVVPADFGMDNLLFRDPGDAHTIPGRMAQLTAVNFLLASLSLALAGARTRAARWLQQGAATVVGGIGLVATLGHAFNVRQLYGPAGLASMAMHTAAAFMLLGAGLLFARPDSFARVLLTPGPGGQLARRLLPAAFLLPATFGWLHEMGEKSGLFTPAVGAGLFVLAMIGSLAVLIGWAARTLDRADAVRRETEAQLRSQSELMHHAREALIVREMDGAIRFWNRGAETLYGWPATEALGQRIHVLLRTEGLPPDHEARLAQTGHWEGELVHTSRDGRQVTVESRKTAVRAADGSMLVLESNRDITDRKQAEKALRESEERLRFALETSHTGAWDLDLVDHTAYRSLDHDRIFGYANLLPQWTYEMFLDHVLPEDRAMVDGKFRGAMETKSDWSFECRIRRPDGQVRWIWAAGRHRPDAAGAPRLMAGIVQDITERKAAEEALRRVNENLEQFAYVASHDLQEPLRTLSSFSQLLAKRYKGRLDQDADEFVGFIVDAAARMQKLITDLLAYSRAGRESGDATEVDCNQVIQRVVQSLAATIEASGGSVTFDPLPTIRIHEGSLMRVFQNLIGNALKFHGEQSPRVHVSAQRVGGRGTSLGASAPSMGVIGARGASMASLREASGERSMAAGAASKGANAPSGERVIGAGGASMASLREATMRSNDGTIAPNDAAQPPLTPPNDAAQPPMTRTPDAPPAPLTPINDAPPALWQFSVSDNGIGIDPQYHERIFRIFQRLHPRDKYTGTGVGLSICKRIIENLGGRIWVESAPGAGTTFHFTIPAPTGEQAMIRSKP